MRTASPCPYEIEPPQLAHTWRLQDFLGTDTRVFFFLRDPIDCEISHYWEMRNKGYRSKDPAFRETHVFSDNQSEWRQWSIQYPTPNDYVSYCKDNNVLPSSPIWGFRHTLGALDEYLACEDQIEAVLPFWNFEAGVDHIRKITGVDFKLDYRFRRGRYDYVKDMSTTLSSENVKYLMTKLEDDYRLYHYIRYSKKMIGDPK
jgi:hypothetical protein